MKHSLIIPADIQDFVRHQSPNLKKKIRRAFDDILQNPNRGKPLSDELAGKHSYRVGKFRVVYQIKTPSVTIIDIGPRRTIYQQLSLEAKRIKRESS
jgi:mRNA-degrading endonuclease RelE of RelBE toxin-antitoxin system